MTTTSNGPQFNPYGLRPEIVWIKDIIAEVYDRYGCKTVRYTSGCDRTHSPNSLHYVGAAIDVWWDDNNWERINKERVTRDLKQQLGPHYDVVSEAWHIHIEYQPEKGVNL